MNVIVEGHCYQLDNFENPNKDQIIQFIQKELINEETNPEHRVDGKLPATGTFYTVCDGTTNEEVLAMLIDRMYYLNNKIRCKENSIVITKLEEALMWLNKRTNDRINRNVEGTHLK